jgi:hypothetical protein
VISPMKSEGNERLQLTRVIVAQPYNSDKNKLI